MKLPPKLFIKAAMKNAQFGPFKISAQRLGSTATSLALVALLAACGGGSGSAGNDNVLSAVASDGDISCGLPNFQGEMTARINAARAAGAVCGGVAMPPAGGLRWNTQLQNAATAHSTDMAAHNFFAHQSPTNGTTLRERVPAAGYNYSSAGENLGAGQSSIAQVVAEWLASPSHCATLMKANFVDMGVSCKANGGTAYGMYWTMELGTR
jgi:uncharacterized protein YkwD